MKRSFHLKFRKDRSVEYRGEVVGRVEVASLIGAPVRWSWRPTPNCPPHLIGDCVWRSRLKDVHIWLLDRHYTQPKQMLREYWDGFSDADPLPVDYDTFVGTLEAVGLIKLVPVTRDALSEPFAAELGVEKGGTMWTLTKSGHAAYAEGAS